MNCYLTVYYNDIREMEISGFCSSIPTIPVFYKNANLNFSMELNIILLCNLQFSVKILFCLTCHIHNSFDNSLKTAAYFNLWNHKCINAIHKWVISFSIKLFDNFITTPSNWDCNTVYQTSSKVNLISKNFSKIIMKNLIDVVFNIHSFKIEFIGVSLTVFWVYHQDCESDHILDLCYIYSCCTEYHIALLNGHTYSEISSTYKLCTGSTTKRHRLGTTYFVWKWGREIARNYF